MVEIKIKKDKTDEILDAFDKVYQAIESSTSADHIDGCVKMTRGFYSQFHQRMLGLVLARKAQRKAQELVDNLEAKIEV